MKIFLKELKEGKTDFSYTLEGKESEELFKDSEIKRVNLNSSGWIQRKGLEYIFYLHVKGFGTLICARCLDEFQFFFNEDYTYNVFLGKDPSISKKEYNISDKDVASIYVENYELNVLPLIKEIVLLTIPMKPLCKENCKGLCPVCGANLNNKNCGHETKETYSPFTYLLKRIEKKE
ncbi:MAG: DUF177 domain-containing protein [candidate division WOR-3 bacterium]